jgi:prepilin-type N-terminal cleavage/methylation domain-containing protein
VSIRKRPGPDQSGFTLVELLLVIMLVGVLFASFGVFFNGYLKLYANYQKDANNFSELAQQSQRISYVVRGIVDIISEAPDDLSAYAYFSPVDNYTSVVHYYLNANKTALMADVTPMTANPPNGTLITASKRTYTIIANYSQPSGASLFTYYDAGGGVLTTPVANQHIINSISINLSEPASQNHAGQQLAVKVSLRNRKVNL